MMLRFDEFANLVAENVAERISSTFDEPVIFDPDAIDGEVQWRRKLGYVRLWPEGGRTYHVGARDASGTPRQPYEHGQMDDLGVVVAANGVIAMLGWFGP